MSYEILKTSTDEAKLFFSMDGENAERHGAICNIGVYVEHDDGAVSFKRYEQQRHLETSAFKAELNRIINFLRGGMEHSPLGSRQDFKVFCREHEGETLKGEGANVPFAFGVKIQTADYSYYLRCQPEIGIINILAFDNRYLLPELAGKHGLPDACYSVLPSSGELILITCGVKGYTRCDNSKANPEENRFFADTSNKIFGVTRGQEEAMLAGSMFGWNTPAANPKNYDENGKIIKPKTRDDAR